MRCYTCCGSFFSNLCDARVCALWLVLRALRGRVRRQVDFGGSWCGCRARLALCVKSVRFLRRSWRGHGFAPVVIVIIVFMFFFSSSSRGSSSSHSSLFLFVLYRLSVPSCGLIFSSVRCRRAVSSRSYRSQVDGIEIWGVRKCAFFCGRVALRV